MLDWLKDKASTVKTWLKTAALKSKDFLAENGHWVLLGGACLLVVLMFAC